MLGKNNRNSAGQRECSATLLSQGFDAKASLYPRSKSNTNRRIWDHSPVIGLKNPNLWPEESEIPSFQAFMDDFYRAFHAQH